jgi:hypothetical protein
MFSCAGAEGEGHMDRVGDGRSRGFFYTFEARVLIER